MIRRFVFVSVILALLLTACGQKAPMAVEVTRIVTRVVTSSPDPKSSLFDPWICQVSWEDVVAEKIITNMDGTPIPWQDYSAASGAGGIWGYLRLCQTEGWMPASIPSSTPLLATLTPAGPSATPKPTTDKTMNPHTIGSFMVGREIRAGIWRSTGIVDNYLDGSCYLVVKDFSGDIKDNTLAPLGATIRVPDGEYIVQIENCVWEFLQP